MTNTRHIREALVRYYRADDANDIPGMREQAVRFQISIGNPADLPDGVSRSDLQLLCIAMQEAVLLREELPIMVAELISRQ